jgi:undecaprenyl-diphosphatase
MYELDVAVTRTINGWAERNGAVDLLMIWASAVGIQLMILAAAGLWRRRYDRLHTRHVLAVAGCSFLFGLSLNQLILLLVHRLRPYDGGITHLLIGQSTDFSFPSDHAAAAFAIAATFVFGGTRSFALCFLAAALLVSLSRVYVGVHYASDVLGGALTGVIAAAVVRSTYLEGTRADRFITNIL